MAKKNKGSVYDDDLPGLDISSLIDVCFLLLIYFIVTTTIQASEQDVAMKLPSAGGVGESEIVPMLIKIDSGGVIFTGAGNSREQLDSDPDDRDVPILSQRVEMYKVAADAAGSDPVVQMAIDGDATQQRVLDCLNVLAREEIGTVTFTDLLD